MRGWPGDWVKRGADGAPDASFLAASVAVWRGGPAGRLRLILAAGYVFGALSHFRPVYLHGWLYHGPWPAWSPWFWYGLCAVDLVMPWLLVRRPRAGIVAGVAIMVVSLWVNWLVFPRVQLGMVDEVAVGLTAFGLLVFASAPWLWRRSA